MGFSRQKRFVRVTALVYCEGEHDQIFVRYLVSLYCRTGHLSRPKITVKKGRGGSADGLVEDAKRVHGLFSRRMVKLDRDRPGEEIKHAEKNAKDNNIQLIFTTPCLEALLLEILELGSSYKNKSAESCKKVFREKYIPDNKRRKAESYRPLFTKSKLNKARKIIPELDELLKYLEDK